MVRVNIINPRNLSDQHLVAEYLEILMLITYAKKHPSTEGIPNRYCLGKGHIKFFKNKLKYLKKRHEKIKQEMKKRGFKTDKTATLQGASKALLKDWRPKPGDKDIIKKRLIEKLNMKSGFYKYYREKKPKSFFIRLIRSA